MASKTPKNTLSLYGNLGGDPEPHTIEAKSGTRSYYDPIIDDAVETSFDFPSATSSPSPSPPAATATSPFAGTTASIGKASPSGSARATASRRPATSRTAPTRRTARPRPSGSSWSSATSR